MTLKLLRLAYAFSALVLLLLLLVLGLAIIGHAQDQAMGAIDAVCADNGAWVKWAFGVVGGASLLANLDQRLPAPLRIIAHLLAGNFFALMRTAPPPSPPKSS